MSKYTEEYINQVLNRKDEKKYSSLDYIEGVLNRQKKSPAAKAAAGPLQIQQPETEKEPQEPEKNDRQTGGNWLTKLFGPGQAEKNDSTPNQRDVAEKNSGAGDLIQRKADSSVTTTADWQEKEKAAEQRRQELIRQASQGKGTWSTRKTESTEAYRAQYADRAGVLAEKSNILEKNLTSALEKAEQMGGSEAQRMLIDDELTNKAVNDLLEQTSVEDYLAADEWIDLEQRAAIALLNRYRDSAENREAAKNYDSQTDEKKAELDLYAALEEKLGTGTTLAKRVSNAAGSMAYNLLGTPDVLLQTGKQAAADFSENWNNEEWQEIGRQIVQVNNQIAIRQEIGGQDDPELQSLLARRQELEQQRAAVEQRTPLDQSSYGAKAMAMSAELNRQGQEGLSKGGKVAYGVGYSVADNLSVAPLYFVPGGGGVALGIQGAKAGAQRMAELGERGVSAGEALARGAVSGGIEAATEKIGMDNLVDIVGKGGKKALNSWVKGQLTSLAKSGGQSAAARVASAIVSNAGAEGLEEAASYIGNYAADQLFEDPESEFSVEEFLGQAGMGALAGAVMGGGGAVLNGISRAGTAPNGPQTSVPANEGNTMHEGATPAQSPAQSVQQLVYGEQSTAGGNWLEQLYPGSANTQQSESILQADAETQTGEIEIVNLDNTAVDDNPETHTAEELARIEEYKNAADPGLANFYENVLNGQYDGRPYIVGMVNDRAAQAIDNLTGINVRGNAHTLDDNGVRHIENRHGAEGNADNTMADVEDVSRAQYILDNFDEAHLSKKKAEGYSTKDGKPAPVVIFSKKIDGSHVVVEAACDGKKKRSYIISEYISPNGVDAKKMAKSWYPRDAHRSAPTLTSETQIPMTSPNSVYHASVDEVNGLEQHGITPESPLQSPMQSNTTAAADPVLQPFTAEAVAARRMEEKNAQRQAAHPSAAPAGPVQSTTGSSWLEQLYPGGNDTRPQETSPQAMLTAEQTAPEYTGQQTSKSQSIQNRKVSEFVDRVGEILGVPRGARREYLRPLAAELAEQIRTTGHVDQQLIDQVFDTAYSQGVVEQNDFYETYKDLKDQLRASRLTLDSGSRKSGAYYQDLLRKAFGVVQVVNDGGVPVDVAYQELSESYPNLFDSEITNPLDQLERIVEVGRSIHKTAVNLESLRGEEAEEFRYWARNDFDRALEDLTDGVYQVRRLEEDVARQQAAKNAPMPQPINTEQAKAVYEAAAKLQREADRVMSRAALTKTDKVVVDRLLKGEVTPEQLQQENTENLGQILMVYQAKKRVQDGLAPIRAYNAQLRTGRASHMQELLEGTETWKDKKIGLAYSTETMERNVRDISKGDEVGRRLVEEVFTPVHQHEAEATRWKENWRQRIKDLGLNKEESEYTQIYGELAGLEAAEQMGLKRREAEYDALKKAQQDYLKEHSGKIDQAKVEEAVSIFRAAYDQIFEQMNDAYIRNGYAPVQYRKGYFPHFTENRPDGFVRTMAKALGFDIQDNRLPTDIAGLTYQFRPGRRWNPFAKERTGFETTYDAVRGFDRYLEVAADVIYHTEDIQNLRALEDGVRYKYGDQGIKDRMDRIRADETLTEEERRAAIESIQAQGKSHLSNFVQEVNEYTNLLAGKKSHHDRMVEKDAGRTIYQLMANLENRVAANMVAVNPGSWLTNFIPITQASAEVSTGSLIKAARETAKSYFADDGFADRSVFLTNRRGSDPLSKTALQKISGALSSPMQYIDEFTSNVVTRGKYLDNVKEGMDTAAAMADADAYAARLMADRSKGALPTVFGRKNPLTRLLTMYQVEVNNQARYLVKDLPDAMKGQGVKAIALAMLKFTIFAYLYNDLYELLTGRRSALDFIDIANQAVGDFSGYELPNTFTEIGRVASGNASSEDFRTERKGAVAGVTALGENVAEQMPFVGGLLGGGRVPISSALPDVGTLSTSVAGLISGETNAAKAGQTIGRELAKPAAYILPPVGGGQIKKAVEGGSVLAEGGRYTINSDGERQLQFAVEDPSAGDWLKALTFGPWALPEAQEYLDSGKSKSVGYTQAYEDGYSTNILEQLYPSSTTGKAGQATYEGMLGSADAAPVDSWLQKLYGATENKGVLPSNTTTSVTVDGESWKLTGTEAMEFAGVKQQTSYSILSALYPVADSFDQSVQANYAAKAQDYAAAQAKEQVLGIAPAENSWVTKVQDFAGTDEVDERLVNAMLGSSIVAETEADYYPNGKAISGSRKRKALAALREAGFSAMDALKMWEAFG